MRRQIVETARTGGAKAGNLLRESLQWEILAAMHGAEAFREVAFVGGTCLRLMHGLKRFSEDLDFKGRDWYDLLWYLGRKVEPNTAFLKSALNQQPSKFCDDASSWKEGVRESVEAADWAAIHRDLAPFLETGGEIEMMRGEIFIAALTAK